MTTEQQRAKEQAAVMLAFAEGKKIEFKSLSDICWHSCGLPRWDWLYYDYRIAPDQEPCATPEMLAKLPGGADKWERVRDGHNQQGDYGIWVSNVMNLGRVERLYTVAPIVAWEEHSGPTRTCVHVYRRKQPQLPPIPDGFELVPSDSQDIPEIGWKYSRAGNASWERQAEGCDRSCKFWSSMDLRFIRPIRKPKMPDGIFWFRTCAPASASLVDVILDSTRFRIALGVIYSLENCVNGGCQYSHDRKTWYDFTGKLMQ